MKKDLSARLPTQLDHLDDQDLARLVTLWRLQALGGNCQVQRIAQLFEIEQQRRHQTRHPESVKIISFIKSWLKFW